jgi:penicillin-binding protein 2
LDKYFQSVDNEWYKRRLTGVVGFIISAFIVLFVRLFYLQIIAGKEFRRLSETNCIRLQSIDAPRGMIYDRSGELLVDNRPSFDLSMVAKDAAPVEDTLDKLCRYIDIRKSSLKFKLAEKNHNSAYKPVLLKKDIGRDMLAVVEAHKYDLPGIYVNVNTRRYYLNQQSAAHLIGYLGEINRADLRKQAYAGYRSGDLIGKLGVEKTAESFLMGKRGGRQVEVDATGRVIRVIKTVDSIPGHNVYLTIDKSLQQKAEKLLKGRAGAIVAMDPKNGDILALASSPSFDQNVFIEGLSHQQWRSLVSNPLKPLRNKAIQGEYPPASTYKIVTAMAGLEERVIDENTTFFCPGFFFYGGRAYRCWKKGGHGTVNVLKALAESCDVFFYQVGLKLGVDRIAWYAKATGLGTKTGIDLDHEGRGLIPTADWKHQRTGVPWQRGETLSIAIGQGYNLVTPIQMAVLTSAVANGGIRYKPNIIREIRTAEGERKKSFKPEVVGRLSASKQTLALLHRGLWEVVNGERGTAKIARLEGIEICGKTGTAQVFGYKSDEEREKEKPDYLKPHAWFVAYGPTSDPKIAVSVLIEHGEKGSTAAAPVASAIIKSYLALSKKN